MPVGVLINHDAGHGTAGVFGSLAGYRPPTSRLKDPSGRSYG